MKKGLIYFLLPLLIACNQTDAKNGKNTTETPEKLVETTSEPDKKAEKKVFVPSTYDDPEQKERIKDHLIGLQRLNDAGVFNQIHQKALPALPSEQQTYFTANPHYSVLSSSKGDLFHNGKTDYAFVVYDEKNNRFSILTYNKLKNKYAELYRDLKVENGLEDANCNYSQFGMLDYILADEFLYQEEYLIKKPESYLEYPTCKIGNMKQNTDLILKEGCFAKKVNKSKLPVVLSIASSSVYNNWECLQYEPETNSFCIIYGQAFAD
ncbi:hypothetical protein [Fluviicola sp.]|uniref:hypothetical protein n=1 Tax=Fluviicola sp. TaxID=1917219 RepID=UPI0026163D57|nr:hypothetical protein [Fluviicola sp.]